MHPEEAIRSGPVKMGQEKVDRRSQFVTFHVYWLLDPLLGVPLIYIILIAKDVASFHAFLKFHL